MFHRLLLFLTCSFLLPGLTMVSLNATACADTQPAIAGAQIVSNNQSGVIYSTPNIPGHTYSWSITGGVIISGGNTNQISVNWGVVGAGSVTVTETNPSIPCFTQVTKNVKIQPLLISYFYYTNTSCYGDMLSYWDASVADVAKPIVNYYIDFGDATPIYNSPVKPNPVTHTYAAPYNVTYTITYIITNNEGFKDTIYDAVYVNPNQFIPTAAFTFSVPNCSYEPVSFDGSISTTPLLTTPFERFSWDFGDPASGLANLDSCKTCSKPTHLFSGPGTYNVTLTVLNHTSCINSITQQVVVAQSVPSAAYAFSFPTCENNPVFFTDQSTFPVGKNIVTWEWYFGDGTAPVIRNSPASPDVSHVFPALGPYTVELRVINNLGCIDSAYHSVGLTPSPVADFTFGVPCAGDTMHFQNHSQQNNGPAIVYYDWDFGDPASGNNNSNQMNGTHVYNNPGTYTIRLAIANTTGCPDTIRKTVTINAKPPVEFTWNVGNMNNQIAFHIDSLPTGITDLGSIGNMCQWNFGDGTYGTGHNPVHTYLGSNNWTVTLTVTDTMGCSGSVAHVVYVPEIPMAFYSSNAPVCLNNPMCFTDLSSVPSPPFGFINIWTWDFGDGSPTVTINFPDNPNVCHTYLIPGTYLVTLYVTDNSGFTDSYSHDQTVLPLPIANFFWTTACQGAIVQFTDGSFPNGGGNVISWDWNFGDPLSGSNNLSNQINPTHIFSDSGCYNVRLIIRNFDDCRDTIIKQVCVFPHPPVDFTRDTACLGDLLHFYADQVITHIDSIVTWSWDFGDGTTNTDPVNTSHLYLSAGVYITTLTVVDHHGCINSVSHQVRVNPKPIPEFSWSSPACESSVIQFTDQSSVPAGYTGYVARWLWDFGDGTTQNIIIPGNPNVTHVFPLTSTSFLVRLTVWSSDSCMLFQEHTVNLIPAPIAGFGYSPITCQGQVVQFNDLSQTNGGGSITQWNWNFGDPTSGNNISTIKNPTHTFATAGSYTVTLIIQNATGCSDTTFQTVTVNQLPFADFHADSACLNNITTFTDLSIPNAVSMISYSWDFGDGSAPVSMQNPTHTYLIYGTFNVKLTVVNSNGCTKDTTKQVIVHPLPIPAFTFSSPNCFGAVVHYTNLSHTVTGYLGSIVKWVWNFDDGVIVTINAPGIPDVTHTFVGNALTHNVRLTITTSDSCTAFIEHLVTSIPAPIAFFGFPAITCADQSVQFQDFSQENGGGAIMTWNWNFGDPLTGPNNTSFAKNPIHFFSGPGTFTVTLIVTNTDGCQDTVARTVAVSMLPVANFTADTACLGSITTFSSATSIPNSTSILSYSWDFGDGVGTSLLANPIYIYTSYGLFNVKLTITNSNGCVHDTTKQVLVHPLPIAAFSYTTPNCLGSVVQFTNQSTTVVGYLGSIVTWVWHFGDGTPDVIVNAPGNPNVTHVFNGAIAHTVRLTVTTSDGCVSFIEHVVNSMPSPIASFSFPTSNCANQTVQFTDNSQPNGGGNITQWHWDFGDPASGVYNIATTQSPSHTFMGGPGVYTVIETVYNGTNCSDADTQSVTIIARPIANFHADTVCLGSLTTFTDQSTATGTITQRFWQFGDGGTSNLTNPTYMYLTAGVFNVTLTVTTNEGCTRDTTKAVLVIPKPVASFTATAPTCAGDSVLFHNLSTTPHGTIVTWHWDFGDGGSTTITFPGSPDVNHLYTLGGTYTVVLTITTSDNCTDSKSIPVIIQPAPTASFIYGTTRCALMPVQFTDQSQTGGGSAITIWLWNFGDPTSGSANISPLKDPVHSFTHSGTFSVNLMVTNATGCFDSVSQTVTINAAPVAQFTADTACVGSLTQFNDQSVPNATSISSWVWDFGDPSSGTNNSSTLQNPTHTYTSPGNYGVKLTVTNSNSCVHDTTIQISVNPKPQAMFSASVSCVGDSTSFTDLSIAPGSGLSAWFWDFGDGGTSTIENPKHKYTSASTFSVMLRVTNLSGCTDSIVIPVTTHPKPVAAFSYTSFFCPAGEVVFQDQSQGVGSAIIDREWIFMPGSTSSLINPSFIFPVTDMKYLVSLIVTDSYGCMDTVSDSVYVKPGFAFTFNNDTVCFKDATHFTPVDLAQGDSLYNPTWDFGDPNSGPNNISYQFAPIHTFTQPGIFIVKLRVTDSDNCTDSLYREVIVHALPAPAFSILSQPCDSVIHFRDSSSAGSGSIASWEWNFGDGSPNVVIPGTFGSGDTSHIYLVQGIYPVVLRVTNSFGCIDTVLNNAELYPCIIAWFSHNDTLMCARYNIEFRDSSLPVNIINQWHWYFGDGLDTTYSAFTPIVHHTFVNPGTYDVKLVIHATVPGSGQTFNDTTQRAVVIHPTPLPYFSNLSVCKKQTTIFLDTSNTYGTPTSTWKWNFGESYSGTKDTSSLKNPTHKYDSAGVYTVQMVVMNGFGCKDSITKQTRVFEIPTAIFDHSIACSGNPTYFTDKTLIGDTANIVNWLWNFGETGAKKDTSMLKDPIHQYKAEGDYVVRLIVKDQHGCYDTVDSTIRVNITPTSSFTFTENINNMTGKLQFQNKSNGADSYFWDFGNGQTSTDENPVVTYANDGSFLIELISNNQYDCSDTTFYRYEFIFKGLYIPNAFAPTSLTAGANTFAPIGVNLKQFKIEVYDNWGHLLWTSTTLDAMGRPTESWNGKDDANALAPAGTYMWKASATFIDNTIWEGSDIGKGQFKTFGTVTLIR